MQALLEINNLCVEFKIFQNYFKQKDLKVIKNLSLKLYESEILAIVGSSGSGKSVFSAALMGILAKNAKVSGTILYKGKELANICNFASLIPQSVSYLDPLMRVKNQIKLSDNPLSTKIGDKYPFECSGGMIRSAMLDLIDDKGAKIIIADEPTPGLDTQSAARSLQKLQDAKNKGKSIILITHDIDLALEIADKIAVFYNGTIIEIANKEDFTQDASKLRHPYTKALYKALPQNGFEAYEIPRISDENTCFCAGICKFFDEACTKTIELKEINSGFVRCSHAPLW